MRRLIISTFAFAFLGVVPAAVSGQTQGALMIEARSALGPVSQVEVSVGGTTAVTDARGEVTMQVASGEIEVTAQRFGYKAKTVRVTVAPDVTTRVTIDLEAEVVAKEEITVTATRTEQRIEDAPLRVEVLRQEEVEEKALMTPGDIAMLLNETGGLRVQVTAPSLGAANVRVQGLRGRYTQILADGLPLYGGQTGAIGLLQIPPLDLGQVEVIKGVASALYGSSALGGVVNLVSRRPKQAEHEFLVNRTSRGGTDAVVWIAEPKENRLSLSLLAGAHAQDKTDIDHDGWADLAGYRRATIRPRMMWDNGKGNSMFATIGIMSENRDGGTMPNGVAPDGSTFNEGLRTRRVDGGFVGRFLVGSRIIALRGSVMTQRHRHQFGPIIERDRHDTWFGEASIAGTNGNHTWAAGAALQTDLYRGHDVPRFDYTYIVPAVFAQDDYAVSPRITLSASGRADFHSAYGAFINPRLSALVRMPGQFTARLSTGTGVFAPTPFTEETEAVGLTNLQPLRNLKAENAWSGSGDLGWSASHVEVNGTLFGSRITRPVMVRPPVGGSTGFEIVNSLEPTRTVGTEFLARVRGGDFGLTFTHTFVHSTEMNVEENRRNDVPVTPKHTAGIVGTWEKEGKGRIGIEAFYTGNQRLDHNPFRTSSNPYWVFGVLVERRFGAVRLFVNGENLGNVRQTRYERLVRPDRNFDGRWTVDAWAPLDGRVINGGVRLAF